MDNYNCGKGEHFDQIILISIYGSQFSIERKILIASSKYFAALLGPNFAEGAEGNTNRLELEVTCQTLEAIVNFISTGCIELTVENIHEILEVANYLQIELLEENCWQYYDDKLSVDNAVNTLLAADRYSKIGLRQAALNIIYESFERVPTMDIQTLGHLLLEEILKHDKIQAPEELVFERLLEWYRNDKTVRTPRMSELLKLIRLEYIPPEFLRKKVEPVYSFFQCVEHFNTEYERRTDGWKNVLVCRARSLYCVLKVIKGVADQHRSGFMVKKYNVALNCFEEAAVITTGDIHASGIVLKNGKFYVLGGLGEEDYLKSVSVYNLNSNTVEILPEMHFARSSFNPTMVFPYIYVFGGRNKHGGVTACERFDTISKKWEILKPLENASYCGTSGTAVVGGKFIYLSQVGNRRINVYDLERDEWTQLPEMHETRQSNILIESNNYLYAMGGGIGLMERYDQRTNLWTMIQSFTKNRDIQHAINIDGNIVAVLMNGNFGKINEDGEILNFEGINQMHIQVRFLDMYLLSSD